MLKNCNRLLKYEGLCEQPEGHEGPCGLQGKVIRYAVRLGLESIETTIDKVLPQDHPAFHDLEANIEHWDLVCAEVDRIIAKVREQVEEKREKLKREKNA